MRLFKGVPAGACRHPGKSCTLEAVRCAGAPALIATLAVSKLELADLTYRRA